jgi:hypothetical protein
MEKLDTAIQKRYRFIQILTVFLIVLIILYFLLRGYRIFHPISIPVGNPYNLAMAFLFVWFIGTIFFVTLDILVEYKIYYE